MVQYISALSAAVKQATKAPAVSVLIRDGKEAGQEIPHVHIHFIPRHSHDAAHRFSSGAQAEAQDIAHWGAAIRDAWTGI